jgi:dTDP-4-dehydrorhamnose 3,5-epimerase
MRIERTRLDGVLLIHPHKHGDARGFVAETFKASALRDVGVTDKWVQENHSFSARAGTLRGLHFQAPPMAQAKLVRVLRGAILDVALDIRCASASYGQHVAVELSAENFAQLYIPAGFAHGFCTLTDDTEVLYKVSAEYAPAQEGGVLWKDPDLAIAWPVRDAVTSTRDAQWPALKDFVSPF